MSSLFFGKETANYNIQIINISAKHTLHTPETTRCASFRKWENKVQVSKGNSYHGHANITISKVSIEYFYSSSISISKIKISVMLVNRVKVFLSSMPITTILIGIRSWTNAWTRVIVATIGFLFPGTSSKTTAKIIYNRLSIWIIVQIVFIQ